MATSASAGTFSASVKYSSTASRRRSADTNSVMRDKKSGDRGGWLPSTSNGGSYTASVWTCNPCAAASRARSAPDDQPKTCASPSEWRAMMASRSSASRSTEYGAVSPLSPLPRRSYVYTLNCGARSPATKSAVGLIARWASAPSTRITAGPSPVRVHAMLVPSREITLLTITLPRGDHLIGHSMYTLNRTRLRSNWSSIQQTDCCEQLHGSRVERCCADRLARVAVVLVCRSAGLTLDKTATLRATQGQKQWKADVQREVEEVCCHAERLGQVADVLEHALN